MTNVCFAKAIKLGHGNGDRLGYHGGHAPTLDLLPRFTLMQMSSITCTHTYFISIEYIMLAWVI